ncbi:helix-turn-helix domain-containing protein [Streptomyces hygroscopicus]|uniref:helix-turn-helix domain-containing protein n=1 Tax=Streptomyces hygroscopicus TaxID=1912 RepID=UPI001FCB3649|nr:hypothetical protein [Streptomyces hygroscopicus]
MSHQTVLNISSGKITNPGINTLRALARVFQVTVGYLLGESDSPVGETRVTNGSVDVTAGAAATHASPPAMPSSERLAERLNHLFEVVQPKGRAPFTEVEVAEAVARRGCDVSESAVIALRSGTREDPPTLELLQGIADFFMVPVLYFLDAAVARKVSDDLGLLSALRSVGAREVAMRAMADLPEEACMALVPMIEHLGKAGKRQRM